MPLWFPVPQAQSAFPYQQIAPKALELRCFGLSDAAIARALGVSDKTVAKAVRSLGRPET